jgi:hypothetical protein
MGQQGRETIIQTFTWERNAANTMTIYQDLISEKIAG